MQHLDKKSLSERDICTKFITPALRNAGWDEMLQIREEVVKNVSVASLAMTLDKVSGMTAGKDYMAKDGSPMIKAAAPASSDSTFTFGGRWVKIGCAR